MPQSPLDAALLRRIQELQQRCEKQQQITHTDFLDEQTAAQVKNAFPPHTFMPYIFSGGYPDAERQILFFLPDWQDPDSFQPEEILQLVKITPASAQGLTHRDYLGSLMALGIKREKLGDILVTQDGAQVFALPTVVPFLISNLTRIGRTSATVEELPRESLVLPTRHTTRFTRTVASLRCDSLLAAAFSLSRAEAAAAIAKGLVAVNHLPEEKPDRILPETCMLSIRGQGRVQIETEQTRSRKGRIFVDIIREN